MANKFIPLLYVLFVVFGAYGQATGPRAVQQPEQVFPSMNSALQAIESKYHARVGVEYSSRDTDREAVRLDLEKDNLEAALNRLVAQKPQYSWNLAEGVYNLSPKHATDSLLDVRVKTFSIREVTPESASEAIGSIPEVKNWLRKHGVRRHEFELGSPRETSGLHLSLTVRDGTVRSILNQLIVKAHRTNWTVVRYGQHSEYITIQF